MGMGFEVVYSPHKPLWVPVDGTATLAVGMLVHNYQGTGGAICFNAAAGLNNITNKEIPWGVVIGTNDKEPSYSTLSTANVKVQTIAGVNTDDAQIARYGWMGAEGMYAKGDPQPLVRVVRITPETVLKGYFRNSATVGTTVVTTQTATTCATTGVTTDACGFTPVAQNATMYCVAGTNAGIYRIRTDTSTTVSTVTREWPYLPVAGDTFKSVNVRQGICYMNIDTTYGMWIDNTAALTSHAYTVNVLDIDLSGTSGNEHCLFSFCIDNFLHPISARTATT